MGIVKEIKFADHLTILFLEISKRNQRRKVFVDLPKYLENYYQVEVEYEILKCQTFESASNTLEEFIDNSKIPKT